MFAFFLKIFFFENLKKIQSCPILHLPYKKPFIFSAFLYSWFFVIFYRIPFWNVCFGHFVSWKISRNTIHLRLATRQISCSHAVDNLSVITAVGNCILPASLSKIPIPSLSLLWGIFSFFFLFNYWYLVALCSFNLIVCIHLSSLLLSIYCSRFIHSFPS